MTGKHRSSSPEATVKVGLLHSLEGPWAIGEIALKDAELMAIAEINQAGGVLGKLIEPVVEDGASEPAIFEAKARKLIQTDRVATIFGCWASTVRKTLLPRLEQLNALLWYPVQYEGLECSKNIFYTGVCANQQIEPAVRWLLEHKGNRFYLVGSDIVFSRTCNKIIKAKLRRIGGEVLGENYVPVGGMRFEAIVAQIKQAKPDVVFSTVNSDSNLGFYQQYRDAGITPNEIPILAVSVTEEEVRQIGGEVVAGHYAAHSYFQSLDTPQNHAFVQNFKAMYGADRVTCDPVESAYVHVYLWKQAVEAAQSFAVDRVRAAAYGQVLQTPAGIVRVEQNQHLWKPCRIGKVLPNGQFALVDTNDDLVKPQPWLGIDDVEFPTAELVIDMLAEASQAIQYSCQLEQKSRELMEANQHLQALSQRVELLKRNISNQIRSSLELDTILSTAVREIRNLLQVDRCKFLWCQADVNPVQFELSHEDSDPTALDRLIHQPILEVQGLSEAVFQSTILRIDNIATDKQLDQPSVERLQSFGFHSLLAVSIRTRSGRLGVIVCEHASEVRPWGSHEVELLRDVADQLAIAIDQAELYAQARAAALQSQTQAEQLQQTLNELKKTQTQLVQTEKMSSLGQLVAGIAHEINNPVNFIHGNLLHANQYIHDLLGLVQLYQHQFPDPGTKIQTESEAIDLDFLQEDLPKLLSSMQVGADRIREIVCSLRVFSRLDEAEMKAVDIHEGIDSTLMILHSRMKARSDAPGIQVIKEYGELPLIECYPGQLNQVFMNLIANAIDALEEHQIKLAQATENANPFKPIIHIYTKVLNPQWIAIYISDNGPGIPAAVQKRLFDPFFTTKAVGKGTGLGLSISYQVVTEKHGGTLQCFSVPELGTKFVVEVPIQQKIKLVT
ncbi:MAG: transporter substrate-binding protein [Lyngbya sp. HA4199-MV5]|jgi:urea transport system substrate-binding protein|nr:transporter substrate-binding protein [Lyngbya sp. HA4199-MV5]